MSLPPPRDIEAIFRDGVEIDRALERAARAVHREHKLLGIPLVIWRDGKVVQIPPEEIVVEPEPQT